MKTPSPPNPYDTAAAQQGAELGASQASSIINNPNQVTPYGTSNYSVSGYETIKDAKGKDVQVPRYTQTVTLSPEQQGLLNLQNQMQTSLGQTGVEQAAKLQEYLRNNVTAGSQNWMTAPEAGMLRRDETPTDRNAVMEAMMARYRENAGKAATSEAAQLAARGLNPGSAGYGSVADTRARALTDASMQAYLAAGDESRAAQEAYNKAVSDKYAMDLSSANFGNQLRQAQTSENIALRNQPINEISALMSGSQVTTPSFNPFQAQGVNAAPIGNYINSNYQAQLNNANAFNSGLFNLGGAAVKGAFGLPWGSMFG